MGIVTYVGPFPTAEVDNHGQQAICQRGVQYTLPDDICAALLAEEPGWWQAGDQHTAALVATPNAAVVTVTGPLVVQPLTWLVLADATAGPFTVTLPDATAVPTRQISVRAIHLNSNVVTVVDAAGRTIDAAPSATVGPPISGAAWLTLGVVSDGGNWRSL